MVSPKRQSLWHASAMRTVFSNASGTCGNFAAIRAGGIEPLRGRAAGFGRQPGERRIEGDGAQQAMRRIAVARAKYTRLVATGGRPVRRLSNSV